MKKVIFLAALLMIATQLSFSQRIQSLPPAQGWGVHAGAGFTDATSLVFGCKTILSPEKSIRFNVGVKLDAGDQWYSPSLAYSDGLQRTVDESDYRYAFSLQFMSYALNRGVFHLYAGGGPAFSYAVKEQDIEGYSNGTPPKFSSNYHRNRETVAGVALSLGIEWFATNSISASAEYSIMLGYINARSYGGSTGENGVSIISGDLTREKFGSSELNGIEVKLNFYF